MRGAWTIFFCCPYRQGPYFAIVLSRVDFLQELGKRRLAFPDDAQVQLRAVFEAILRDRCYTLAARHQQALRRQFPNLLDDFADKSPIPGEHAGTPMTFDGLSLVSSSALEIPHAMYFSWMI